MINLRIISKIAGVLLLIESGILLLCSILPLCYAERDFFSFLASSLIAACMGLGLYIIGTRENNRNISKRDGYIVVVLCWIAFSIAGAFPFYLSGALETYSDSFFETLSGFTTTGASVIRDLEAMPHGILFWRSLTQWIGGLGIVFFTVAVLPVFGIGEVQLFAAEATGPIRGKLHPRISTSGRWILTMYVVLTIACSISLWLCGMTPFDSINHGLCTIATGGDSTRNASIAAFNSPAIEWVIIIFMFLSGINFGLLFAVFFKQKIRKLLNDTEFIWYSATTLVAICLVIAGLAITSNESVSDLIRHSAFEVIASITTTGFISTDYNQWHPALWMIMGICMYMGACAGSTTGAMKSVRTLVLYRALKNEFNRILHPNAVLPIRMNGKVLPPSTRISVLAFTVFYFGIILFSWVLFTIMGIDPIQAYSISISFIGNHGVIFGDPSSTLAIADLPAMAKWYGLLLMLVGRLEIFSVLIIFMPSFWKHR